MPAFGPSLLFGIGEGAILPIVPLTARDLGASVSMAALVVALISIGSLLNNIPASLKAWVDHIVRKGATLGFDGQGLVQGKKATVLVASGGVYTEGSPIRDRDIATQYLRLILGVIGIEDVTVVAGGGAKSVDLREQTMDGFLDALQSQIDRAAGVGVGNAQPA